MIRNFGLYGVICLLIQGLVACGPAENSTKAELAPTKVATEAGEEVEPTRLVVAFGDSLYAGYRLGAKEGLAPQLQAALRAQGLGVRVINAGVSGDTTAAGKARLNFVLDNAPQKPELVILGLGGNDMLRGIKPEQTRANLTAMMDELDRRGIDVVLTGILSSPNMGADYAKAFNPIFPDLSKKYNAPLYPFFLDGVVTDSGLMLDDGIHPNAAGVAKVVTGLSALVSAHLKANGTQP